MTSQNFKHIHIGEKIKEILEIKQISIVRASSFLKCSSQEIKSMFTQESLDSLMLLKWCKLLDYNLFMFYHSHLQIYKPSASSAKLKPTVDKKTNQISSSYTFRKNIYSPDIIQWLLSKLATKELSVSDIINTYHIPKTTVYRWLKKEQNTHRISQVKKKLNYNLLYTDFLLDTTCLNNKVKMALLNKLYTESKEQIPYKTISKINSIIKTYSHHSFEELKHQQLKAYDKDYAKSILSYQIENNLSDLHLSQQFKLSRNTLKKWKNNRELL